MNLPNQQAPVSRHGHATLSPPGITPSDYSLGCVGASTRSGNRICASLPLIGTVCIKSPIPVPSGASVKACAKAITTWGIPRKVCVNFEVQGRTVASKCVGI